MTVEEFLVWLRAHADGPIEGCTDEDIEDLMAAQGVSKLPPAYEAFLRGCGRRCSPFRKGTAIEYPLVAEAKEWMQESLTENGPPLVLPGDAFVFYAHGGYHYWYFPDVSRDEVWEYSEGHEPEPFFRRFEDWLDAEVAYHEFVWGEAAAAARGETVDWSVQFHYEPYRTLRR